MQSVTIEIPGDIVSAMKIPRVRVKEYLLVELAVSMYRRGILSFGKARELCRMSKWDFQRELGTRQVERHYEEKDLEEDIDFAYSHQ